MTDFAERTILSVGELGKPVEDAYAQIANQRLVPRIWDKDPSVWKKDPEHRTIIENSLGWLRVVPETRTMLDELASSVEEIRKDFAHVVVLGMGGSSLCPEVLRRSFGERTTWPELRVLDSTVPAAIRDLEREIELERTLFLVASKSGGTTEPQMFYRYFRHALDRAAGNRAGEHFVAITDRGTRLARQATEEGFRRALLNPSDIGGRYSALSLFGMVPAALAGYDVAELLDRAAVGIGLTSIEEPAANPAARLGALIGSLASNGRNKLTLVAEAPIDSVGLWIEQLIAESTGKEGKGVIPVAGELLGVPADYDDDRVFIWLRTTSSHGENEEKIRALIDAGHPVVEHRLSSVLDLGQEFLIWEFATAVAGSLMGIDPFDQPNVQESKDNTKRLLEQFVADGHLPEQEVVSEDDSLTIYSDGSGGKADPLRAIAGLFSEVRPGDYVAVTQYIEETPEHDRLIRELQMRISRSLRVATTTGYGPRFLHSTGQLHKGGSDDGVFLQITSEDAADLQIPGEPFGFSILKRAQALGDFQSLASRGRRAIRIHLKSAVEPGLTRLNRLVDEALRGS